MIEPYDDERADITLTATNVDKDTLKLTLPWDTDLPGLVDAFRTVAFWLTFLPSSIDEHLPDPVREWAYVDEVDEPEDLDAPGKD